MSRRSPFESSQFGKSLSKQAAQEQIPVTSQAEGAFSGDTHLQGIPTTDKKSRDREWEKHNKTVGYRSVPIPLRDTLSTIAREVGVRADDIARAFLEYGLDEYRQGRLALSPVTNALGRGKMTLYPQSSGWGQKTGWKRETWDPKPRQVGQARSGRRKKKTKDAPQEVDQSCVLTVRYLPEEVHQAIVEIAQMLSCRIGDVAARFLVCGVEGYLSGEFVPNPVPMQTEKTLYPRQHE